MNGPLAVSSDRCQQLIDSYDIRTSLQYSNIVGVSSVMFPDVAAPRFQAVLDTVRASCASGMAHVVMVDDSSHPDVFRLLREAGAIVILINHADEGGLARPFVIAAQIIAMAAPWALMVKFEGEKSLFALAETIVNLKEAASAYDVITGERDDYTWSTMPPYQVLTETWLGYTIGALLDVSIDTPSGVLALNQAGRQVFVETTTDNSWPYLFITPCLARQRGLRVGAVSVSFKYHPLVVEEETGNPVFDKKRRHQLDLMIDKALEVAGVPDSRSHAGYCLQTLNRFRRCLPVLASL